MQLNQKREAYFRVEKLEYHFLGEASLRASSLATFTEIKVANKKRGAKLRGKQPQITISGIE